MSFGRKFFSQTIASVSAFAISLLLTPIMTRVFGPNAYGSFAIINGAAVFLATLMQLSMPSMIPIARGAAESRRLIDVSLHLGTLATITSSIIAAVWIIYVVRNDHHWTLDSISSIATLPLLVASVSLQRISQNIVVATRDFNRLATARVMHPIVAKPLAIIIGLLLTPGAAIILLTEAIGNIVQHIWMSSGRLLNPLWTRKWSNRRKLRVTIAVAKRESQFSVYDNLNNLLNLGFISGALMIVGSIFSTREAGLFSLALGIVNLPVQLVSLATASLIYSKLIDVFGRENPVAFRTTSNIIGIFVLLGSAPYCALYFYGPELFAVAFGAGWSESGTVASSLAFANFLLFVFTPVQAVYRLTKRTQIGFYIDLLLTTFSILAITVFSAQGSFGMVVASMAWIMAVQRILHIAAALVLCAMHDSNNRLST